MRLPLAGEAVPLLTRVRDLLSAAGTQAYLVGGYLRDALLGEETQDIDIAVAADALEVARAIAGQLGGKYVVLDESAGVARVVLPSDDSTERRWYVDFSTLQGDIRADLQRRDFTIDAMALNLNSLGNDVDALIDPFHGAEDLNRRLVRAVSPLVFRDDPVRLIRGPRLAAQYGLAIEASTEILIVEYGQLIRHVAGERVREELCLILGVPNAASYLGYLDRLGLLTAIIPELDAMKGVDQPREHYWDVFEHSVQTVKAVEGMLDPSVREELLSQTPRLRPHVDTLGDKVTGGVTRAVLLKLAALLHDVAKPRTKFVEPDGRARFYGHTKEGAEMTGEIMQRLRFSNKEIRMVQKMIEAHLRLWQMGGEDGLPTRRAIYRYFRDTQDVSMEIMFLTLADFLATQGPELVLSDWRQHCQLMEYVLRQQEEDVAVVTPPKLIDGNDLMRIFGLQPGPGIGELLEAVREAQGAGEIVSREQAIELVRQRLSEGQNE